MQVLVGRFARTNLPLIRLGVQDDAVKRLDVVIGGPEGGGKASQDVGEDDLLPGPMSSTGW